MSTPAGWHPDPMGRYELRYWDGQRWTEHVSSGGQQGTDPEPVTARTDTPNDEGVGVAHEGGGFGAGAQSTSGDALFTELVLVVNQKAKLVEITNEYAVRDQNGNQIAAVRQTGQNAARKVLRALTSVDQYLTQRLEVVAADGRPLLELVRPAKVFKSTVVVSRPGTGEVGRIVQENVVGKIRFGLMAGDQRIGSINAENWRAWNFSIRDAGDQEVARITKTWEGLAKAVFTTADNYVVAMNRPLDEPLRSLVVAAAVSVDTALKQDAQGFN